ncbi:MAG: hypothetical protein FD161_3002 [Limisphaerales bacterium]|nr:MAG: hypothetical protein FD161_3002 [Limisphaerales bacterium]KAG0508115.1 MAG: hypothetical protein E1N63_2709 [Limisphaerales bacterium]TXT53032.1 MAG: hypothetical protein FD140_140 [Limisphaerales bacterium]
MSTARTIPPTAQFETDFWFPHARQVVTVREVALVFAISDDQVRDLCEEGLLVAAGIGDQAGAQRAHLRIERWSAVAWRLNELEKAGVRPPIKETPQVTWWRQELKQRAQTLCPA